jgi:general stress protein 26
MPERMSPSDPGDFAKLGELIRDIRVALLTTVDRDGGFHNRPVQTLQVEADRTLWFFTDWSSPKVDELQHDVRVSLGYADPAKNVYAAVSGLGSLLRDLQEIWCRPNHKSWIRNVRSTCLRTAQEAPPPPDMGNSPENCSVGQSSAHCRRSSRMLRSASPPASVRSRAA